MELIKKILIKRRWCKNKTVFRTSTVMRHVIFAFFVIALLSHSVNKKLSRCDNELVKHSENDDKILVKSAGM